jgi:integrase
MKNDQIKSYKQKSGKKLYRFQIYLGKNEVTGSSIYVRRRGFTSRKAAEKAYKQVLKDIKKGVYTSKKEKHYRVNDLVELWLKGYQPTVRESTYASTLRLLHNHILPSLGSTYLDKLTTVKCMQAVQDWFKVAPKTVGKIVAYCNLIFRKGVIWGMLKVNPMDGVDIPKLKKHAEPKNKDYYTKQELAKYLACAKRTAPLKVYTYFRLSAYSGMRRGEELALTWSDIDFEHRTIKITKTLAQGKNNRLMIDDPKTRAGFRIIQMDRQTMDDLKAWQHKQAQDLTMLGFDVNHDNQLIFSTENNTWYHPAMVAQLNTRICKLNGLRHIRPHGFRHTHATLLQNAGVSAKDAQARLGHSDIRTTLNTYTHETAERQRLTADKFSSYMSDSEPTSEPNIKIIS